VPPVAEVLLGVSGGIAAYKAVDVLRGLMRRGHDVTVVMTASAQRFVGPATFAALSGRPVGTRLFGPEDRAGYDHLELARRADLALVAPASANTLARMAAGLGDGLLGSVLLAFTGPVLVAPAMNTRMYEHPATVANLRTLVDRGVEVVPPGEGLLADGETGVGRLAAPGEIVDAVIARLGAGRRLAGRRVLVSAGGTREPIDAVRYVGNRSSGRMGFAVAEAAAARGAEVVVLAANVELPRHAGIRYVDAPTADALREACLAEHAAADIVVMAAAVADYRPAETREGKLDKAAADGITIDLERTEDILSELVRRRPDGQAIVGFAAEHGPDGLERARAKRARKGVDLLVHNDVSVPGIGFSSDENEITIIGPGDAERTLARAPKRSLAEAILDAAEEALAGGEPRAATG
jgi:phosphopantothenoylcysteine decarboxylase/phosphopantothenate--cysteine ligase